MRVNRWLIPGIWLSLFLSLVIMFYANESLKAGQQNKNFSLADSGQTSLSVSDDNNQAITITLHKNFTKAEQEFLRAVAVYHSQKVGKANAYQLQFPLAACEFSAGLLMHCESQNIGHHAVGKSYRIGWLQNDRLLLQLRSQQLPEPGLALMFRTSRAKKTRLGSNGQMKHLCILQVHLKIAVFKGPQQNGTMAVEDVFFDLSERACEM